MNDQGLLSCDNGIDQIVEADATDVAREYYTSYSKYVLEYRALPSVYDGLKPVQRRIIYTMNQFPQKLMKTAKAAGAVMAYHPHGSASIEGSIDDMAHPLNVFPMFTTKGNFGGVGFGASSSRYTECYLSELARQNFCQFLEYADYEVGEIGEQEPVALPTLIPYCLFKGSEGIGVGLSTKIIPLNLLDIIDYYIETIKTGSSQSIIKPDVGYVLLEMDNQEIYDAVMTSKGRITVSSVVTQISNNTFLIEGLYERSIESVINKLDKAYGWFTKEQVGFRDASTSSMKYIFEIYDNTISPKDLKEALVNATRRSGTYTRVVEEDGNAVYSSLNYIVQQSLAYLNKVIDKKLNIELSKSQEKLDLFLTLDKCKSLNLFKSITSLTQEELVDLIIQNTNCSSEIAWGIIEKPISYLTRTHLKEETDLINKIDEIQNHDRKKYLLKLYKDFRKAVLPFYEEKKHTITKDMLITNPCIKFNSSDDIQITDGDGIPFNENIYFIYDDGYICKRTLNTTSASSIFVEAETSANIVGVVSDKDKYIKILSRFKENDKIGGSFIIESSNISYDKKFVNLRENEYIIEVYGINRLSKEEQPMLKGIRLSKTTDYKLKEKDN